MFFSIENNNFLPLEMEKLTMPLKETSSPDFKKILDELSEFLSKDNIYLKENLCKGEENSLKAFKGWIIFNSYINWMNQNGQNKILDEVNGKLFDKASKSPVTDMAFQDITQNISQESSNNSGYIPIDILGQIGNLIGYGNIKKANFDEVAADNSVESKIYTNNIQPKASYYAYGELILEELQSNFKYDQNKINEFQSNPEELSTFNESAAPFTKNVFSDFHNDSNTEQSSIDGEISAFIDHSINEAGSFLIEKERNEAKKEINSLDKNAESLPIRTDKGESYSAKTTLSRPAIKSMIAESSLRQIKRQVDSMEKNTGDTLKSEVSNELETLESQEFFNILTRKGEQEKPKLVIEEYIQNKFITNEYKKRDLYEPSNSVIQTDPMLFNHDGRISVLDFTSLLNDETDINPQRLLGEIVDNAVLIFNKNRSEIEFHIKPEYLGKVTMRVIVDDGTISAKIIAQSQEIRDFIQSHQHELIDAFEEQGYNFMQLEVNVGDSRDNSSFMRHSGLVWDKRKHIAKVKSENHRQSLNPLPALHSIISTEVDYFA